MLIALDRDLDEPMPWKESLEFPAELLVASSLAGVEAISCTGRVEYVSPGFLLTASVSYEQVLECTRCLRPIRETASHSLEVLLMLPQENDDAVLPEEIELERGQLNVVALEGEEVETSSLVFEVIQLQVPMKPLCRDDCLGLCPRCGADRNETPDCCTETGYDPRWSGLQGLKERLREPDS